MTFIEKVQKLCTIAPDQVGAFHVLIDSVLREQWWATARSDDGLKMLARLVHGEEER